MGLATRQRRSSSVSVAQNGVVAPDAARRLVDGARPVREIAVDARAVRCDQLRCAPQPRAPRERASTHRRRDDHRRVEARLEARSADAVHARCRSIAAARRNTRRADSSADVERVGGRQHADRATHRCIAHHRVDAVAREPWPGSRRARQRGVVYGMRTAPAGGPSARDRVQRDAGQSRRRSRRRRARRGDAHARTAVSAPRVSADAHGETGALTSDGARASPRAPAARPSDAARSPCAVASPPPMHRLATPRLPPYLRSAPSSVTTMRAPDAPIGWPSAQAPPCTLTLLVRQLVLASSPPSSPPRRPR